MFSITKYMIIGLSGVGCVAIACILYLVLGLTVIQTYNQESNFQKTECIVRGVEIHKMNSKEDWYKCPWKCTVNHTPDGLKTFCEVSEFPCLRIVVDVKTNYGLKSAILHESREKMERYSDCSTYYCDQDSVVNERDVNRFRKKYGAIGSKYSCFYNVGSLLSDDYDDDGQEHALLRLTYNQASYINSLFWPSFAAFVGIICVIFGFVNFVLKKREIHRKISKRRQNPNDI